VIKKVIERELSFDSENLMTEFTNQAALEYEYGYRVAVTKDKLRRAEDKLKASKDRLFVEFRDEQSGPIEYIKAKVTVRTEELRKDVRIKARQYDYAEKAYEACLTRGRMLQSLGGLRRAELENLE